MDERIDFAQWIKEHKKQLIIAGVGVGALTLLILGIKHDDEIKALWDLLRKTTQKTPEALTDQLAQVVAEAPAASVQETIAAVTSNSDRIPFEVRRHIRNLPDGWHPSPEKIAEALNNSIVLVDGQTWVESYTKGAVAA